MANTEIRVGITADASDATGKVRAFSGETVTAFERMTAAQAAYDKAAKGSVASQMALAAAFDQSTAAGASFTEAMEAAVAATTAVGAASGKAATGLKSMGANASMVAGEMRVLEGSGLGAARVLGTFLAGIPGIGEALTMAFSAFAVLAFAEIAVTAGKAIYTAFDMGGERARKLQEEIRGVDNSFRVLTDSTNVEIDKLQEADAKLEHKPSPNGLKLALDEALESADRMSQKLDGILQKEEGALKGMAGSMPEQMLGSKQGTEYEQTMLTEHTRHLDEQTSIQGQLNESQSYYNSLLTRRNELQERMAHPSATALTNNYATEIAAVQELMNSQAREQQVIKATIALQDEQKTHEGHVQKHQGDIEANKAAQEQLRGIEIGFDKLKMESGSITPLTAGEAEAYWAQFLSTFKAKSEETKAVLSEYVRYQEAVHKQFDEARKKIKEEGKETGETQKSQLPFTPAQMLAFGEAVSGTGESWRGYNEEVARGVEIGNRGREIQIDIKARLDEVSVAARKQSGAITKVSADHQMGAIQAKEYSDKLKLLTADLNAARTALSKGSQGDTAQDQEDRQKLQNQVMQLQNQIAQLRGQGQVAGAQNQAKTAEDMAAPYIKATDTINASWLQMQNKLIFGTRNVAQAFANMGVSMLESVAASFEKMLVKQLQMEIRSQIAHQAANTAKLTSDATAAATHEALIRRSGLREVFIGAKVAAVDAFKWASSWGGPIAGAIAAAVTFPAVMAVGAFETGGIIPNTGIALVHQGEAVLPRNLTQMLTSSANSNTTSNSSATINSTANYQGITDRNFRDMARRHSDAVADAVGREVRGGRRL